MELGTYRLAEINKGGGLRQKAVGLATQYLNGIGQWVDMPTAMTPTVHNHAASEIGSGTLELARLPRMAAGSIYVGNGTSNDILTLAKGSVLQALRTNATGTALEWYTTQWKDGQYGTGSIRTNSATAGLRSGDEAKPYVFWSALAGQDLKAGGLAGTNQKWMLISPSTEATYAYGGVEYTYNNTLANYVFLILIDNADFIGSTTDPFNRCRIIANAGTNNLYSYRTILAVGSPITGNVYPVIISTGGSTAPSGTINYTESVSLYAPLKSSSYNYSGAYSVASGQYSVASGAYSVASGAYSVASGDCSVASGQYSVASGAVSIASGYASVASGYASVASGFRSVASGEAQTVIGKYNVANTSSAFIIGNGTSASARSNCMTVDFSGNITLAGSIAIGASGYLTVPKNAGANRIAYFNSAGTLQSSASYTLLDFASASHNHDATYLKLSGGTVTGQITLDTTGGIYKSGWDGNRIAYFVSGELTTSADYTLSSFALTGHNHDGVYSPTDHTHAYSPTSHASSANTYGLATASLYGHAMASSATPLVAGTASVGTDNGKFAREGHVHPAQTSVSGSSASCTGNAASATKLATARTISLTGSVTGSVSFDGSGDVSITTTTNHTHSYLPLAGGTVTGKITLDTNGGIYKSGWDGNRIAYFVSGDLTTSSNYTLSSFALATHNHNSAYSAIGHNHSIPDLYCGVPDIVAGRLLISGSGGSSNPTWMEAGTNGKILGWASGAPAWVDAPSGSSVSAANPTASVGLSAVNGSASTFMRSDAAPKLDVSISPTWTGTHTFNGLTQLANVGIGVSPSTAYKLYVVEDKEITTAGSYIGNYLIAKYNTDLSSGTRQGIALLGQLWANGGTLTHAKGLDFKVYVPLGTVTEATAINAVIQTDGGSIGTAYGLKLSRLGTAPTVANYGIYQDDSTATNVFKGTVQFDGDVQFNGDTNLVTTGRARNIRFMTASGAINHTSGTDTLIIVTSSNNAELTLPTSATTGDRIEFYSTLATASFACASALIWPINNSSGKVTTWGGGMGAPAYSFAIWDGTYWRVGYLSPQY